MQALLLLRVRRADVPDLSAGASVQRASVRAQGSVHLSGLSVVRRTPTPLKLSRRTPRTLSEKDKGDTMYLIKG